MYNHVFISFSAVQIWMIFHIFICILHHPQVTKSQCNQPPVGIALNRYRRGHGFESSSGLNSFPGSNFTTVVCDVQSCLHTFLRSSNVWSYIRWRVYQLFVDDIQKFRAKPCRWIRSIRSPWRSDWEDPSTRGANTNWLLRGFVTNRGRQTWKL